MDRYHFLQCEASEVWKKLRLKNVEEHFSRFKTPIPTKYAILKEITIFYYNNIADENGEGTPKKIREQEKIDWDHFCRGWISKDFTIAMKEYYSENSETFRFTGKNWTKNMIIILLDIHLEEWYFRCTKIASKIVNFGDHLISIEYF